MSLLEALLVYRPLRFGQASDPVSLGSTGNPSVLRAVRDQLLEEAGEEVERWRATDPVLGELAAADADRLAHMLALFVPDEAIGTRLRVIERDE